MLRRALLGCLLFGLGCGGVEQSSTTGTPAPADQSLQIEGDYSLAPGQESYLCYTMNIPKDKDIVFTKMIPTYGEGTHHILFSQTIAPEPAGKSECNVLIKTTWLPLYAGGKDSGPLETPPDSGIKPIVKGQQLLMQLHLQNTTNATINTKTSMRIEYVDASAVKLQAGIFGFDDHLISIPAHSTGTTSSMTCPADKDMDVFAVLGHMHKFGKHLSLSRGKVAGGEMLFDEPWSFDTQPIVPKTFKVSNKEDIFLQCDHANGTDMPVGYGESSNDEMCAAIFYYTPYDQLDGCTQQ